MSTSKSREIPAKGLAELQRTDLVIVGAGIVGLATAWRISQRFPSLQIHLLEKESRIAADQSSHNSGVLHTGIYYRPGSLRAENCRLGKKAMEEFCVQHEIPFQICGKVIVAQNGVEQDRLQKIYERGQANGVECSLIDRRRLQELEPHASGVAAIHVPQAGIIHFPMVCQKLAELLTAGGHQIHLNTTLVSVEPGPRHIRLQTSQGPIHTNRLITCGGLWSDRLIRMSGKTPQAPIVPFRGEFYHLAPEAHYLCRSLIYPVPDPAYPFLGVHFTRTIKGGVECGPNAVLALARDGYSRLSFHPGDAFETLSYEGFRKMALKNWRTGLGELWRSWSKQAFVKALQRLVPEIRSDHLLPAPSGVRAQAVNPDGTLVDDFVIQKSDNMVHVGNAPSPAATASLNIGRLIADQLDLSPAHPH